MTAMTFEAGLSMGACIWPRTGAYPQAHAHNLIRSTTNRRLNRIQPLVDKETVDLINDLLQFRTKDALRQLCHVPQPVTQASHHFRKVSGVSFKRYTDQGLFKSGIIPLGMFLLAGQSFDMYADFTSKDDIGITSAYAKIDILQEIETLKNRRNLITQPMPRVKYSSSLASQTVHLR